jgi:hypothetical protein
VPTEDARLRGRCRRFIIVQVLLVLGLVAVAHLPVTTKQGVNFEVSTYRIPLYHKVFEFLDRDAQYRVLASTITRGALSDADRVRAVFNWTARRIQPTPDDWAIVDDHILNIIIRGYGTHDQRADVVATLTTYAGVPSFWREVRPTGGDPALILTFALVQGRWVVMDVGNRFLFQTRQGELATLDDFSTRRAELPADTGTLTLGATPYSAVVLQTRMPAIPDTLRAELQMPWRRLWYQTRHAIGQVRDDEDDGIER